MLGRWVLAERLVMWVVRNLRIGDHTQAAMLDTVLRRSASIRPIFIGILMNTLGWCS
jgi:hypothetical protein